MKTIKTVFYFILLLIVLGGFFASLILKIEWLIGFYGVASTLILFWQTWNLAKIIAER